MQPKRKKISPKIRQAVYDRCAGHCAYCGAAITIREMQIDHFLPMELGVAIAGRQHEDGIDSIDNFLPACRSCNNYKSTLTPEKFRKAVYRWHDVLMRDSVTYRNAVRFGQVLPKQHVPQFFYEKAGIHIPAMDWYQGFRTIEGKIAAKLMED